MTEEEKAALETILAEIRDREAKWKKQRMITICLAILLFFAIIAGATIALMDGAEKTILIQRLMQR